MNDKERLQAIKDQFEWGEENLESGIYNLESDDINWLIKQAEKVEQLETDKEFFKKEYMQTNEKYLKVLEQLQQAQAKVERYEKALQKIIDESICRGIDCTWGDTCYAVIARKALEGEGI